MTLELMHAALSVDFRVVTFLIAGGDGDPNLLRLSAACRDMGLPFQECFHGQGLSPAFTWDIASNAPIIHNVACRADAAFVRYDVFEGLNDPRQEIWMRAHAWYQAVNGWLLSNPCVRMLNRHQSTIALNKPAMLVAASRAGLRIPETKVTNQEELISQAATTDRVTKPISGGGYCYALSEVLDDICFRDHVASCPAFIQTRLSAPEVRIYVIGRSEFAFEMRSDAIDYRVNQDAEVIPLTAVPSVIDELRTLMSSVSMDYGAADFKSDPQTGELVFLELNSSPMFARFDIETGGQIARAIVSSLTES